jgi:hypothetical protein
LDLPDSVAPVFGLFVSPEYLNHEIFNFDSVKMGLHCWAILTTPDSVSVSSESNWRLSEDKKTIFVYYPNAGEAIYSIVMIDNKQMMWVRKK